MRTSSLVALYKKPRCIFTERLKPLALHFRIHYYSTPRQEKTTMDLLALVVLLLSTTKTTLGEHCDYGTEGDGGCEANGLDTYCVR
jgi:hypothetical protein